MVIDFASKIRCFGDTKFPSPVCTPNTGESRVRHYPESRLLGHPGVGVGKPCEVSQKHPRPAGNPLMQFRVAWRNVFCAGPASFPAARRITRTTGAVIGSGLLAVKYLTPARKLVHALYSPRRRLR